MKLVNYHQTCFEGLIIYSYFKFPNLLITHKIKLLNYEITNIKYFSFSFRAMLMVVVVVVNERETSARLKTQIIVSYDKRTIKCIFAPTEK